MHKIRKILNRLVYNNDIELLNNEYKRSQDYFIIQAIFVTAFSILTGGVTMSGFFVYMGASDQIVGLIVLLPNIVGILLIFSSLILERFDKRKKIIIFCTLVARWMVCSIILVPVIVPKPFQALLAMLILVMAYALQSLSNVALNIWFVNVVPENIRGRYFGIRQMFALIVSIVLPVAAGTILDVSSNKYAGFALLYSIGALMVLLEVFSYTRIDEPLVAHMGKGAVKIGDIFRVPLQNRKFLYYTFQVCFFYLTLYISASFSSVYMIRYLKLSYTFISATGMLSAALQMIFYRIWGRICDRYGHSFVMRTSFWFFMIEFGMWCLAPANVVVVTIPIAMVFSAVGNSGFAISSFNYRYTLIPEKGRSLFEGFFGAVLGISFLLSPVVGGFLKGWLESIPTVTQMVQFGQFRFLYGLSVIGLIALQVMDWMMRKRESARQVKE